MPVSKDKVVSFLRDNRLYLAVRLYPKHSNPLSGSTSAKQAEYYVMKLPYSKVHAS